jgi:1,4-dihydroxy-2-naphthoate octaprenyltransferase
VARLQEVNPWLLGARPRTLPAAVVPVAVGTAAAVGAGDGIIWWRAVAAMVVALALQVGVNYANDYSDGVKGTDAVRTGPTRITAAGLAEPRHVKRAAQLSFLVAGVAGVAVSLAAGPWLILVGIAAVFAAWGYTGGPRPYGYLGLGEVFVFVFFGLVATAGSTYLQLERFTGLAVAASVPVGLHVTALLVINNLRDIPTDRVAGKRTLAVRMGDAPTRWFYVALVLGGVVAGALLALSRPWALLGLLALPLTVAPVRQVLGGAVGRDLIPTLGATARVHLVHGALLTVGLAVSG